MKSFMLMFNLLRLSSSHIRRPSSQALADKRTWVRTQSQRLIDDPDVTQLGKLNASTYKAKADSFTAAEIDRIITQIIELAKKNGYQYED